MVILTWKCLLSGLMLCDSHIMESPRVSSPKTYKPMSSFVGPRLLSAPALCTWLKFQPSRQGLGCKAGICHWSDASRLSWETLEIFGHWSVLARHFRWSEVSRGRSSGAHARWIPFLPTRWVKVQGSNLMKHIFNVFTRFTLDWRLMNLC